VLSECESSDINPRQGKPLDAIDRGVNDENLVFRIPSACHRVRHDLDSQCELSTLACQHL
jgi:hypothetical protein